MTRYENSSSRTFDRSVRIVFAGIALYSLLMLGAALLFDHSRAQDPGGAAPSSVDMPLQASVDASGDGGTVLIPEVTGIRDAAFGDGIWYLADFRSHMVHVVDTTGAYIRSVGRRGEGPGELFGPSVVAVSGSRLWVASLNEPAIQSFDSSGIFVSRIRLDDAACEPGSVADAAGLDEGVVILQRCLVGGLGYALKFVGNDGTVESVESPIDLRGPFGSQPALTGDGYSRILLGNGATGCLVEFEFEAGVPRGLAPPSCLTHLARAPIPDDTREQLETMVARARGTVDLVVPDSLPYFDQIALEPSVAIRALVASGDVVWRAAAPPHPLLLSAAPGAVQLLERGRALSFQEELLGTRISFPQLNR